MNEVKKIGTLGLYAVPKEISRYEKSNFKGSHDILRWKTQQLPSIKDNDNKDYTDKILALRKGNKDLISKVNVYDNKMFPKPRFELIKAMLKMQQVIGFAAKDNDGQIIGYGIIRPCNGGFRVGRSMQITLKLLRL